jgi:hypothetical protein
MRIIFTEWLYNRELQIVEGLTVPVRDDRVAFGNRIFKVVLVTHCYDAEKHYSAKVELEAITNPL